MSSKAMPSIYFAAAVAVPAMFPTTAAGNPTLNTEATAKPSCLQLLYDGYARNGFYVIEPKAGEKIVVYCAMNYVTFRGLKGGWTLVWSNLSSHDAKPNRDLRYNASIYTKPLYEGVALHSAATNVADFQVFVGLDTWRRVSAAATGGRGEMLYEWTPGPGRGVRKPIVRSGCRFTLDPVTWRITFPYLGSGECNGIELNGTPNTDFFTHNHNATWSAVDVDNDGEPNGTCADGRGSPFWYPTCRGGGIAGFGPLMSGYRFLHGAHWVGGANSFGNITTGQGSGDGWLYVR